MVEPAKDRCIVVTGAAQGLGLSIAKTLACAGARVALVDIDKKVVDLLQDPIFHGRAVAISKDLADRDAPEYVISEAVRHLGPLDGLVNCAAWSLHTPASQMTTEQFDRLIAINQRAPFFLSQQFVAQLKHGNGDACIVNIASVNAICGNPNLIAYAGTKGALVAMTRSMSVEFAPHVRVIAISPGSILTPAAQALLDSGTIRPETHFARYPIPRFMAPEEVAELVVFLFSPAAASVTGCNWVMDGGYSAQ